MRPLRILADYLGIATIARTFVWSSPHSTMDHGFKLDALNIDRLVKKGEATTVEFTAGKAGTYPFECSHLRGLGHKRMKGQLAVE